jgi:glycine/serine hydroxymethyltransferase
MTDKEMRRIADLIDKTLSGPHDESGKKAVRTQVRELCSEFPLYDIGV